MTDEWMDRFTYQVVINKKYLTAKMLEEFEKDPIVLKPWDPMGSLTYEIKEEKKIFSFFYCIYLLKFFASLTSFFISKFNLKN